MKIVVFFLAFKWTNIIHIWNYEERHISIFVSLNINLKPKKMLIVLSVNKTILNIIKFILALSRALKFLLRNKDMKAGSSSLEILPSQRYQVVQTLTEAVVSLSQFLPVEKFWISKDTQFQHLLFRDFTRSWFFWL